MTTYAPAKLSARRSMTPEGFLLCRDVRLGRIGEMDYGPGQTPIPVGADGVAHIDRTADVLFHPDTLDSFVGKPVTIKHPDKAVTPDNWRSEAGGHILSARRGQGSEASFMVGDVLVTTPEAIKLANDGCEISSGYDAAYEETGPGRGRQTKIVGNHLAFLPDGIKGRCGPMCYVGDQSMDVEEPKMNTKNAGSDLLRKLFGAKDDAEVARVLDQATQDEALSARDAEIAGLKKTVDEMAAQLAALTKDAEPKEEDDADEDDEKKDTMDAASVQTLHSRIVAQAEILSPGFKVPTFDAKGDLAATVDHLCACQRDALTKAYATDGGKVAIERIVGAAPDFAKMTTDAVGAAFFGASALMAALNNSGMAALAAAGDPNPMRTQYEITADADRRSQEKWAKRRNAA